MKIKDKLTLQFCFLVGLILIVFSLSIFYISKLYRYNAFRGRLSEKALSTANLLIEVEQIDHDLLKKLRKNYLPSLPEESIVIYDNNNRLIFSDHDSSNTFSTELIKKVRTIGETDLAINDKQYYATLFKNEFVVIVSAKNILGQMEIFRLGIILFVIDIIGLLIILLSGRRFANHALLPISKMVYDVEKIEASNLNFRLDEGRKKDEFSRLAITFNKMFNRIQDAFDKQKIFVANASHELRTPLTSIIGEIEVALMKDREREQYKEVLISVLEEAKSLTHLSNNLLRLAQVENKNGLVIQKFKCETLIERVVEEKEKRFPGLILNINLIKDCDPKNIHIHGNIELLNTALMNLIDNAYKFSKNKPVLLSIGTLGKFLILRVKDEGIGIVRDMPNNLFQPFYRGINAQNIRGSGVGLALTDKIIKLHKGKIEINLKQKIGTLIEVFVPIEIEFIT